MVKLDVKISKQNVKEMYITIKLGKRVRVFTKYPLHRAVLSPTLRILTNCVISFTDISNVADGKFR